MFAVAALAVASLAASASAFVVPRSVPPPTYATGYLEDYTTYHIRYLALDCQLKHHTSFFDDCCHPMLATENLKDNRKPFCTPAATASSSAAAVEPTSTVQPDTSDGVSLDNDEPFPADPASTPAPKNVASDPSSDKPAPQPSPQSAPKPAPKPAAAAAIVVPPPKPASGGGAFGNIIGNIFQGGIATFFFQNGVAGACGTVHSDNDKVVALQTQTYANGAHCGKTVVLQDVDTGHTETATVADECPTCINADSVDMSKALFDSFASDAAGTFNLKWAFAN